MTRYADLRLVLLLMLWLLPAASPSQTPIPAEARGTRSPASGRAPGSSAGSSMTSARPALPPGGRKDANVWYFGERAGLSFASGTAVAVTDGQLSTLEGCAAVSDRTTGELKFYTDGTSVWNRRHELMHNGTGLAGCFSSSQAALILPDPGNTSRHYIFTTDCGSVQSYPGLNYSIVDMKAEGGLGSIAVRNAGLLPDSSTEKLTGALHCNGRDYWVLTRVWGNDEFRVYPLTSKGVGQPVISKTGMVTLRDPSDLDFHWRSGIGCIKVSPGGRRLVVANSFINYQEAPQDYTESSVEVYDFDPSTGRISNPIEVMRGPTMKYYGVSFSPDDSKVYVSSWDPGRPIWQVDLSSGDPATIRGSVKELYVPGSVQTGPLQLGPDGRLYVVYRYRNYIGVIREPDKPAPACDFAYNAISLDGRNGINGLPNFVDADIFRPAAEPPRQRITKQADDPTPRYGDTISYTITVCNDGCSLGNVRIQDLLPQGLTYVDGFDAFPRHTLGPIATGECRSVVLRARVERTAPPDMPITNCAVILNPDGSYREVLSDRNCATIVVRGTDIGVEKRASRSRARPGDRIIYTVTITNRGTSAATGIVVRDRLPVGLHYAGHMLSAPGTYDQITGDITIMALEPGGTATLEVSCDAPGEEATLVNCAELVASDPPDADPANDRSCITVDVVVPHVDISVSKRAHPARVYPGEEVTYTIAVRNSGGLLATGIDVRESIPAGLSYLRHTVASPASYDPAKGLLRIPELAAEREIILTLLCSVDGTARGVIENRASLDRLDQTDRDRRNDTSEATITVRVCDEPEVTVTGGIDGEQMAGIRFPVAIPVMLDAPLDEERLSRVRITLRFDEHRLAPAGSFASGVVPRDGTLLGGWRVASTTGRGSITLDLEAPAGEFLQGAGPLLRVPFRIYLGAEPAATIAPEIEFPGYGCIAADMRSGSVRLDSVCGLSLRLMQIGAAKYALGGNAPNPFNPTTTIVFSVGDDGPTRVEILDAGGRQVETLVDRYLHAGEYEVEWNGTHHGSGIYYYRMTSGAWSETRRMVMMK